MEKELVLDSIRLGIVCQSNLLREVLIGICGAKKEFTIASSVEASNHSKCPTVDPHVILIQHDHSIGDHVRHLMTAAPTTKLIVIEVEPPELDIVGCLKYGVAGFALKGAFANDIADTIRVVVRGGRVIPSILIDRLCTQLLQIGRRSNDDLSMCTAELTLRERDVVNLVLDGLSNKEIADRMNISTCTIKSHVHNIFEKLKISSRIDLINYFSKHLHTPKPTASPRVN